MSLWKVVYEKNGDLRNFYVKQKSELTANCAAISIMKHYNINTLLPQQERSEESPAVIHVQGLGYKIISIEHAKKDAMLWSVKVETPEGKFFKAIYEQETMTENDAARKIIEDLYDGQVLIVDQHRDGDRSEVALNQIKADGYKNLSVEKLDKPEGA